MAHFSSFYRWVTSLPEEGRYSFSRSEVHATFPDLSERAIKGTLARLKKNSLIVVPRRGFYVLLPPEYRSLDSLPAIWFIDDLMRHLERDYYVALLTAASLHGAAHQQPMVFQVMTDTPERDITLGAVRIEFHTRTHITDAATTLMQTPTGTMIVATAETTALDLVRYPKASGHWNNVATVLAELVEQIDEEALVAGIVHVERSAVQRLGYVLEQIGAKQLADRLLTAISTHRLHPVPLNPSAKRRSLDVHNRWNVIANEPLEIDL